MEAGILFSVVAAPLAFGAVEPLAYAPLFAFFFLAAARLLTEGRGAGPDPLYGSLLPAIGAVILIGLLQSLTESPVTAARGPLFTAWRPATLDAAVRWLFYAAVLFVSPRVFDTPEKLRRLLWTVFGAGVLVALLGMFQKTGENTVVYGLRQVRGQAFGPFVNRDHGAQFLAAAAMAGLGVFFAGLRGFTPGLSRSRLFDRLALQGLIAVMLGAVIYGVAHTGSRGGLHSFAFAAAASGLAAAAGARGRARRLGLAAMLALIAGYGALVAGSDRLRGRIAGDFDMSVKVRFAMYESGRELLARFPVFGAGLGAVEHSFPPFKKAPAPEGGIVRHVHSDWLELFLQAGWTGGLIYVCGFLLALWRLGRAWLGCGSFTVKALAGGAFGGVLAVTAHSFVDFGQAMPANNLVFFLLLGALASPALRRGAASGDDEAPAPRPLSRPAAALAGLLAGAASLWSGPAAVAWAYELQARGAGWPRNAELRAAALRLKPDPQAAFRLGADYFNRGLKDPAEACGLFSRAAGTIAPYRERVPANRDLAVLDAKLSAQLDSCGRKGRPL